MASNKVSENNLMFFGVYFPIRCRTIYDMGVYSSPNCGGFGTYRYAVVMVDHWTCV